MSQFKNVNHCEKPKVFESHVGVLSMKLLKGKAAKFPRTTFQPHFPSLPSLIWKFIPERRVFWHFFFFRASLIFFSTASSSNHFFLLTKNKSSNLCKSVAQLLLDKPVSENLLPTISPLLSNPQSLYTIPISKEQKLCMIALLMKTF